MYKYLWVNIILGTVFLSSCSKETSIETGGAGANGCRVKSIILLDSASGDPVFALNTLFSSLGKAQSIEAIDSITKQVELTQPLIYSKDSVLLGDNQFIVLDSIGRVKKHQLREDPSDPSSASFVFQFKYDQNGYLIEKTLSSVQLPVALLTYTYTWTSGNLSRIEGKTNAGLTPVRVFLAEMTYDAAIEPKNFIYFFPEAAESYIFLNAFDFGKKSRNLVKNMTVVYFDQQGVQSDKFVSSFVNAKLNADKFVTEWTVDGDSMDPFGIFVGRVRFDYFCR